MRLNKGSSFLVDILGGFILVIVCIPAMSRAQTTSCPAGYQASQYSTDSSGNHHIVSCVDPKTGSYWFLGKIADSGGQVYNVKAFGAKGDSTADDSAAIQSAISATPSGGTVFLPKPSGGTFYRLGSGLTVSTPVMIRCAPNTVLDYTPTTGSAITLEYGGDGGGIVGCRFRGAGSTNSTTAIQVGTSGQGVDVPYIANNVIGEHANTSVGFGTGIQVAKSVNAYLQNNKVRSNGTGIDLETVENPVILGGTIGGNTTGIYLGLYAFDVTIVGTSLDTNTGKYLDAESQNAVTLDGVHFEDNAAGFTDFIYQGSSAGSSPNTVTMVGGYFLTDQRSGTISELVKTDCNYCQFNSFGTWLQSRGATVSNIVNFSQSGAGGSLQFYKASGLRLLPSDYTISASHASYSHIVDFSLANAGRKPTLMLNESNFKLNAGGSIFVPHGGYYLGGKTSSPSIKLVGSTPSGSCVTGSIDLNASGRTNTTLYVCENGAWVGK